MPDPWKLKTPLIKIRRNLDLLRGVMRQDKLQYSQLSAALQRFEGMMETCEKSGSPLSLPYMANALDQLCEELQQPRILNAHPKVKNILPDIYCDMHEMGGLLKMEYELDDPSVESLLQQTQRYATKRQVGR